VPLPGVADKSGMRTAIDAAGWAAKQILDFALPPRCPGCGTIVEGDHRFCFDCWRQLRFLGDPCCQCCGRPFEYSTGPGVLCGGCLGRPPDYDRLRAAVAYGEVARKVVLKLKYGGRPAAAETLAHFMARHLDTPDETAILVPVPLHRWRLWRRGYNQAGLIASALGRRSGRPVELDLLRRAKATPALRGLNRRERALAVSGAFALSKSGKAAIAGRTVILVDDVYTSGATVSACAKVLKRGGAGRVEIICWARVLATSDD
jgi:ComF family protein